MLVGIDASRTTIQRLTGTEIYALHLTRRLLARSGDHRFRLYFRDEPPDDLFSRNEHIERRVIHTPRLWTHVGLRGELRRAPPDVLFIPAHVVPLRPPAPTVVTVHDLGYLYFPEAHPLPDRLYLNWSTRYGARHAAGVVADSESTKRDLVERYRIPADKIAVAYPGINPLLKPVRDPAVLAAVRQKYDLPERYILHVGTLQPRKNLSRLVEAFARVRSQVESPPDLVFAGGKGWLYDDLFRQVEQLGMSEHVHFPGHVPPDHNLAAMYSAAQVYAFPSLFEGFGFPVVEAMRCETPVVCSNTSSLPELAGDAALTVPPTNVDALTDALVHVLTDEDLRRGMIERGRAQAARFTWEACADQVWAVLERAARDGRS
jgi:glycosyltransferase involved in cell wall biosynthesis